MQKKLLCTLALDDCSAMSCVVQGFKWLEEGLICGCKLPELSISRLNLSFKFSFLKFQEKAFKCFLNTPKKKKLKTEISRNLKDKEKKIKLNSALLLS